MIIDTDNYAASGIEVIQFPGGEWHVNAPLFPSHLKHVHVFAKLRTWDDVGKLLAVGDALSSQAVRIYLFAPYFPGMRMDRNGQGEHELGVRMYGRLLRLLGDHVTTVDPHSQVGVDILRVLFHVVKVIDPTVFISDLISVKPDVVVIPDEGAASRSTAVAVALGAGVVQARKKRDFETGKLSGFSVPHLGDVKRILIPDDICDGGGTFVGLLEEIRKQTEAPVDLFVSHGIFSRGIEALAGFSQVYTTDSYYQQPEHGDTFGLVSTLDLLPYYLGGLRP